MGISTLPQTVHLPGSIKHPFLPTIKPNQFSEAVPKCAYSLPAHSQLTEAPVTAELSRLQQWGRLSQGGRSGPRAAPRLRVVVCLDATVDSRERLFLRFRVSRLGRSTCVTGRGCRHQVSVVRYGRCANRQASIASRWHWEMVSVGTGVVVPPRGSTGAQRDLNRRATFPHVVALV